jgi:hypothetical protein
MAMPSLRELQADFAATLFDPAATALLHHVAPGGAPEAARVAVYRGSVLGNYRKALSAVYPVVERLVGERFFAHAAEQYARRQPSRHGDLNRYGAHFAEHLSSLPGAAELAYLPDTARLEWAMEEVFHAAGATAQGLARLTASAEADWPALRFCLAPCCRLLASPWPVDRLWALNQPGVAWDEDFDITAGGVRLLVCRSGFEVQVERLGEGEFALLAALAQGVPLGPACERALREAPDLDLGATLQRWLSSAILE